MKEIYYRITYNGIGVYQAFKKELWKCSKSPIREWNSLKNTKVFNWLEVPTNSYEKCYSYFTKLGLDLFMKNTYTTFIKYMAKEKIVVEKYTFENQKIEILYRDKHQIVVKQ